MQIQWISDLFSLAIFIAWEILLCHTMTCRYSKARTVMLFLIASPFYFLIPQYILPYGSLLRTIFGMISFTLLQLVLFRDKWYKILFVTMMLNVLLIISELLVATLMNPPEILQAGTESGLHPPTFTVAAYLLYAGVQGVLLWIFALFLNRYNLRLSSSEWLLYFAFPISQCLLLFGWLDVSRMDLEYSRLVLMFVAIAVCLAADISLFWAIRGMAQRSELRAKNELLQTQISRQKEHYTELTEQYQAIRKMRHDIASHLYTIEVLLKQGKYREAETYSQEIKAANQFQSQLGNCQNPVVDAYLYSRISELEEQGISVQATVELPNLPDISDVDLIIALGNLLDNARDASLSCEQPEIVLHIYCRNGWFFLSTLNTAPPQQNKSKRSTIPRLSYLSKM